MKYRITESGVAHYIAENKNCRGAFTDKMKILDYFYNSPNKEGDINECAKKLGIVEFGFTAGFLSNKHWIELVK